MLLGSAKTEDANLNRRPGYCILFPLPAHVRTTAIDESTAKAKIKTSQTGLYNLPLWQKFSRRVRSRAARPLAQRGRIALGKFKPPKRVLVNCSDWPGRKDLNSSFGTVRKAS